jgi:hypothetical protein
MALRTEANVDPLDGASERVERTIQEDVVLLLHACLNPEHATVPAGPALRS